MSLPSAPLPTSLRTVRLVPMLLVCGAAFAFEGYDLTVYGTTLPMMLQEWSLDPAQAGSIGSWALVGMLIGSLLSGTVADRVGRRTMMLICVAWFSIAMIMCGIAADATGFAVWRFIAGFGLGGALPVINSLVIEYSPPGRRNLMYAVMAIGFPLGGLLSAAVAIPVLPTLGWRPMYLLGAGALILVIPAVLVAVPESLEFLISRGRLDRARAVAARWQVALPDGTRPSPTASPAPRKNGVRVLFSTGYRLPTVMIWLVVFCTLLLVFALNTWLPQLMRAAGHDLGSALLFLLVFNAGAIVGTLIGCWLADRYGTKIIMAIAYLLAMTAIAALAVAPSGAILLLLFALGGLGTIGSQNMMNAFFTAYYPGHARAAGAGWAIGIGRLGGIVGPLLGGVLIAAGVTTWGIFAVFAGVAFLAGLLVIGIPPSPAAAPTPRDTHALSDT